MPITIDGTNGITQAGEFNSDSSFGFKNRIINGAMVLDQRNAGASIGTASSTSTYTLDRWLAIFSQNSKFTIQQNAGSVTPPVGFNNYLGITTTTAYSGSGDIFSLDQRIEGYNFADLNWGTANAKTVTLSFYVRSSLTGTFGGALRNADGTRSYPFTYTISVANTWEYKTITIEGDTSGTWVGATNGIGVIVILNLGSGSTWAGTAGAWASADYRTATGATSVIATNGATLYITGVQLEVGSTATSFDYRPYGTELALCQRYYTQMYGASDTHMIAGRSDGTTGAFFSFPLNVPLRASPTVTTTTLAQFNSGGNGTSTASTSVNNFSANNTIVALYNNGFSGLTNNRMIVVGPQGGTYITVSAEL